MYTLLVGEPLRKYRTTMHFISCVIFCYVDKTNIGNCYLLTCSQADPIVIAIADTVQ